MGDETESNYAEVEYEEETFMVGGYSFAVTTIAYMPIETLMANASKKVEISGQKLWCGSLAVMEYLLGNQEAVAGKVVVELGAGTGVLGMLCKRLGAARVVLTDNDSKSLVHMVTDCEKNAVEAEVLSLDWFFLENIAQRLFGAEAKEEEEVEEGGRGAKRVVIVAGDVLYKRALLEPFMATVVCLLAGPKRGEEGEDEDNTNEMFLCHVPRAGVEHEDVIATAGSVGLSIEPLSCELWRKGSCLEYCPLEDVERAMVYRITLV